jgi:4-amino-4-deoxy-L-arabinose transferase-like glycosyltransferase
VIALAAFGVFIGGLAKSLRIALRNGVLREEALVCGIAIATWLINGVFDNQVADKYLYVIPGLLFAVGRTSWLMSPDSDVEFAPAAEPLPVAEPRRPLAPPQAVPAAAP